MDTCVATTLSLAVPIIIFNFAGIVAALFTYDFIKGKSTEIIQKESQCLKNSGEKESDEDDTELISLVRESSVLSVPNADGSPVGRSPPPSNSEDVSKMLVALAKQISNTLDGSANIPEDKKQELISLLQTVPNLVKIPEGTEDIPRKVPDRKEESELLMKTLDSLKDQE